MIDRAPTTVIEVTGAADLAGQATRLLAAGHRLALIAAHHDTAEHPGGPAIRIVYLFTAGPPDQRVELILRADPDRPHIPSLAALSFPAGRFEREMRDLFGVEPDNHPLPRQLVRHPHWPVGWHPMRHDAPARPPMTAAEPFPFLTVEGDGVYEIPVGPVHAGLIEPGHFRFSVVGETILRMKARLWYVHKGIEKLFEDKLATEAVPLAERISGDTAVGHGLAYALAVEDALGVTVDPGIQRARLALLELERLHNHVADIGALCNDVAYGIAHAHTQRIRERLFRLNARVTGHRLLRGSIRPGCVQVLEVPAIAEIKEIAGDLADIVEIALRHTVVRDRFTGTATLTRQQAADIGTLGYVARASGLTYDARIAHPLADVEVTPVVRTGGDVLARFQVRAEEAAASAALLAELLPTLAAGLFGTPPGMPGTHRSGVGIVEGWRGAIVHRAEIGPDGRLSRVKVVDPSFLTWPALPIALADTIVPDFPLTNKSFNLSYAGNDL
ncbi:MAG: formate hydrogenase [Hamadaea sp.]|uniref:hydrogenase large subunit n=1 Tax=Hamadaea sp. TaxID=2024425 RepID=UPI0017C42859|nr:NADH-quinone oxidoreductase subunit C [Hamadaea sp.]NUR71695.1 formate hydrogenase [Hamadaea sp.]NUT24263.1 formate hydrogenase [Hamadaea sp.]